MIHSHVAFADIGGIQKINGKRSTYGCTLLNRDETGEDAASLCLAWGAEVTLGHGMISRVESEFDGVFHGSSHIGRNEDIITIPIADLDGVFGGKGEGKDGKRDE